MPLFCFTIPNNMSLLGNAPKLKGINPIRFFIFENSRPYSMSDEFIKGRGAQKNLNNRFSENQHEVLDEYLNFCEAEGEDADNNKTNYLEVFPKNFVNKVNSPDVGMEYCKSISRM